ncbi:UDP-N-acetylglucosamine--N-acetylmuramyl-(pentapeptide) pyrophosphoryl-undecaprenol N-acetylglucosamine transferase [Pelagibacteraceae bacterium]|nr:UDP-N-acetylglucosamine--N-acetylmuramyl-(pentapeptide) pyrophosphoryl-undecaprenol N-acetylglucosamine transferase [Pelagibacteraceae bacterium]
MIYNKKIIIATGGTGGHVFPAYGLAKFLVSKKIDVQVITDERGFRFLKDYKDIKFKIINSATLFNKNPVSVIFSLIKILFSFFNSLIFLFNFKPKVVFGMGGYASFPVCMASKILRIPFITYENNLHTGKANRYLLPYAKKMLVSYSSLSGFNPRYSFKVVQVGNIIRENIINFEKKSYETNKKKLNILILGGSQAAKSFAEKLPKIFTKCLNEKIPIKIFQQCLPIQKSVLKSEYNSLNIENEIFVFNPNLNIYFANADIAITRSGSSILAELLYCRIPIISIPLSSSAENHQYKNAKYFEKKGYSFLIQESEISEKLFPLIKSIHKDKYLLTQMIKKQKTYSDAHVFEKIYYELKEILAHE